MVSEDSVQSKEAENLQMTTMNEPKRRRRRPAVSVYYHWFSFSVVAALLTMQEQVMYPVQST